MDVITTVQECIWNVPDMLGPCGAELLYGFRPVHELFFHQQDCKYLDVEEDRVFEIAVVFLWGCNLMLEHS